MSRPPRHPRSRTATPALRRRRARSRVAAPAWLLLALAAGCGAPETQREARHWGSTSRSYTHETTWFFRQGVFERAELNYAPEGVQFECLPSIEAGAPGKESLYEGPVIDPAISFNEALVSWNIDVPPQTGVRVEVRVGRASNGFWSPYLEVGSWGDALPDGQRRTQFDGGEIELDLFHSSGRYDRLQYRIRAARSTSAREARQNPDLPQPLLRRFTVCVTDTTGKASHLVGLSRVLLDPPSDAWKRRLEVPFRGSGGDPRFSTAACVAMVLAYRGIERSTEEVAARLYDPEHEIYDDWPRAVQAAYSLGAPGCLARFHDWTAVRHQIAAGQPVIATILAEPGQLTGAPPDAPTERALVITGFDAAGDVLVDDPAAADEQAGRVTYRRDELEQVWMGCGGVAQLVFAPE